jgi:hypothetical protein
MLVKCNAIDSHFVTVACGIHFGAHTLDFYYKLGVEDIASHVIRSG